LLSIRVKKFVVYFSLSPLSRKSFFQKKKEKKKAKKRARYAAKRKRNNWRGPFGEETVYAVVFLILTAISTWSAQLVFLFLLLLGIAVQKAIC